MKRDYIGDLMELGKRFDAMDGAMRGYCEPTELGMKIWVHVAGGRRLVAQKLIGWDVWRETSPIINPLTIALNSIQDQIAMEHNRPPEEPR